MAGTETSPIDWRPDGSIKFDIDDVTIRWRPPKVKHLRKARNDASTISLQAKKLLDDREEDWFDSAAAMESIETLAAGWVRETHDALQLEGVLPDDVEEWPSWLPTLEFARAVMQHWGSNPFA